MSLKNLSIGSDVEAPSTDTLGGGGFNVDSGLYKAVVDVAYSIKSRGGALGIVFHFKSADPNKRMQHRQTFWVVSKAGKNYFMGGKNKDKKILLPDMQMFQQICKICVPGTKPDDLEEENKTLNLWNFEIQAEAPTEVPTIPELKNKPILLGLRKCRTNKEVPEEPGSSKYVPTNEERVFTEVHRVFHPDGMSTEEKDAGAEEARFAKTWKKKHTPDFVHDTYKEIRNAPAAGGAPAAADADADVDDDLFDD